MPQACGVYLFLDKLGKALYIGKAKNLRKRTAYYFKLDKIPKRLTRVVGLAHDIKFFITNTENDAFLLEAQLIKEQQPPYNILYKHGRSLNYINFSNHEFPRLEIIKDFRKGSIGPFLSGDFLRSIVKEVLKIFKLRTCTDYTFKTRKRPCLEFFASRCSAPCVGKVDLDFYKEQVKELRDFFSGKINSMLKRWSKELKELISQEKFEEAASKRDSIYAIEKLRDKQSVYFENIKNLDIVIKFKSYFYIESIRDGAVNNIDFRKYDKQIAFDEFLFNYYLEEPNHKVVSTINVDSFKNYSCQMNQHEKKAYKIAKERFMKLIDEESIKENLEVFGFGEISSIETYDCSHYSGKNALGAMVFNNTKEFVKSKYRTWKMPVNSRDDLAILKNTLERRMKAEDLPDLFLIDGGKTQLNIALEALAPNENIIAFAKGEKRKGGILYSKKGEVEINDNRLFLFLESLRDEAHRWAKKNASNAFTKSFIKP